MKLKITTDSGSIVWEVPPKAAVSVEAILTMLGKPGGMLLMDADDNPQWLVNPDHVRYVEVFQ